jgi:hypothetical protein
MDPVAWISYWNWSDKTIQFGSVLAAAAVAICPSYWDKKDPLPSTNLHSSVHNLLCSNTAGTDVLGDFLLL